MRIDQLLYDFEQQKQTSTITIERTIVDDKDQANNVDQYNKVLDSETTNDAGNIRRIYELESKTSK